jgi:hypothetical protein
MNLFNLFKTPEKVTKMAQTLGKEGKDKITGFKGIITARAQYLTGCDQYGLTPKVDEKGATQTCEFFDEARIEIIGNGILPEEVQGETKGGPNRDAPRR